MTDITVVFRLTLTHWDQSKKIARKSGACSSNTLRQQPNQHGMNPALLKIAWLSGSSQVSWSHQPSSLRVLLLSVVPVVVTIFSINHMVSLKPTCSTSMYFYQNQQQPLNPHQILTASDTRASTHPRGTTTVTTCNCNNYNTATLRHWTKQRWKETPPKANPTTFWMSVANHQLQAQVRFLQTPTPSISFYMSQRWFGYHLALEESASSAKLTVCRLGRCLFSDQTRWAPLLSSASTCFLFVSYLLHCNLAFQTLGPRWKECSSLVLPSWWWSKSAQSHRRHICLTTPPEPKKQKVLWARNVWTRMK